MLGQALGLVDGTFSFALVFFAPVWLRRPCFRMCGSSKQFTSAASPAVEGTIAAVLSRALAGLEAFGLLTKTVYSGRGGLK